MVDGKFSQCRLSDGHDGDCNGNSCLIRMTVDGIIRSCKLVCGHGGNCDAEDIQKNVWIESYHRNYKSQNDGI